MTDMFLAHQEQDPTGAQFGDSESRMAHWLRWLDAAEAVAEVRVALAMTKASGTIGPNNALSDLNDPTLFSYKFSSA